MIKTKAIPGYEIKPPKKTAFQIETPPDQIRLHTLLVASGKRGGGKSVAVSNLCAKLIDQNVLDRILLVSPTYFSNKEIFAPLKINEETDVMEPEKDVVKEIIKKVEDEKAEYDEFLEKLKVWKLFQKMMKSNKPINALDPALLVEFMELGFLDATGGSLQEKPKWKYKHERPPIIMCIIDDAMGTPLMNPKSGLVNLCIKHRHIAEGMGLSICLLVQSYCAIGGIPRPIRENCTVALFFKCKDENQIKKIHEEVGADVDLEQFDRMYKHATEQPFGFLLVDFHPKSKDKMFRRNFNEYLSIN
jgi:hypothetical protein